jgi:hypothetical protein
LTRKILNVQRAQFLFIYLFMFGSTGGCTEDPMLAQQALYHLSHSISPTCLIFKKRTINMKCFFIGGTNKVCDLFLPLGNIREENRGNGW